MKYCNPCAEKNGWRICYTVSPGTCEACDTEVEHCNDSGILKPIKVGESNYEEILQIKKERDLFLRTLMELDEAMDDSGLVIKQGTGYHLAIKKVIKGAANGVVSEPERAEEQKSDRYLQTLKDVDSALESSANGLQKGCPMHMGIKKLILDANGRPLGQEVYNMNLDSLLAKFKNGPERFKKNALFNKVIQMLIRDADVYVMLDQVLTIQETSQKNYEKRMLLCATPQYVTVTPETELWKQLQDNESFKSQKNELILQLVEIEMSGSLVIPYIHDSGLYNIITRYLTWKIRRRVNRWAKYKSLQKRNS